MSSTLNLCCIPFAFTFHQYSFSHCIVNTTHYYLYSIFITFSFNVSFISHQTFFLYLLTPSSTFQHPLLHYLFPLFLHFHIPFSSSSSSFLFILSSSSPPLLPVLSLLSLSFSFSSSSSLFSPPPPEFRSSAEANTACWPRGRQAGGE